MAEVSTLVIQLCKTCCWAPLNPKPYALNSINPPCHPQPSSDTGRGSSRTICRRLRKTSQGLGFRDPDLATDRKASKHPSVRAPKGSISSIFLWDCNGKTLIITLLATHSTSGASFTTNTRKVNSEVSLIGQVFVLVHTHKHSACTTTPTATIVVPLLRVTHISMYQKGSSMC